MPNFVKCAGNVEVRAERFPFSTFFVFISVEEFE
jgi:hypothetical protein